MNGEGTITTAVGVPTAVAAGAAVVGTAASDAAVAVGDAAAGWASVPQLQDQVGATVASLKHVPDHTWQVPNDRLGELVGELGELAAAALAGVAAVTAEAEARGVIEQSQAASTHAWIREHAWQLSTGTTAHTLARTARVLRRPDLGAVADAVRTLDITPRVASCIAAEYDKLAADLRDDARPVVLEQLIGVGADHGVTAVRQLRQLLLVRYGADDALDREQDRQHRLATFSCGTVDDTGMCSYQLTLDPQAAAVVEAALGALSKPHPGEDGTPDPRPAVRRRAEALTEVCRRAAAAGSMLPNGNKATLFVTMTLQDLRAQTGAATVIGSTAAGTHLAPHTARMIACDAGIIPVVLGGKGEPLDVGRARRLFTPGQIRALWLRDRHCTWPGCDAPAHWCDAHHLWFWADGGPTDLNHGALLCGRHHTVVHRDRLAGTVNAHGQVLWDRTPGSYDTWITTAV